MDDDLMLDGKALMARYISHVQPCGIKVPYWFPYRSLDMPRLSVMRKVVYFYVLDFDLLFFVDNWRSGYLQFYSMI